MTLASDLISDTERHLMSGDRDEINALAATIANTDQTITVTYELGGIAQGAYLGLDLEVLYVWAVDENTKTVTVQRGMVGSVPATHSANAIVYVNPKVSKWDMFNALNAQINDMSTPPGGLFQVKEFTLTSEAVRESYPIPAGVIDILEIRYQPPGPAMRWNRIGRHDYQVMRNMPTTGDGGFGTGTGLRIEPRLYPGRVITVRYAAVFDTLTTLDDDVTAVSGIPQSAVDIPSLGAAYRLITVKEAKRSFMESQGDSRRAGEVPPGSAARAGAAILNLLNDRMKSEYMQLVTQYPETR